MFTGIIQGIAQIVDINASLHCRTYTLKLPKSMCHALRVGASIANDGCCLTITHINGDCISFDLVGETLSLTTLASKNIGDRINVERAAKFGDEIGGHLMSGHISCKGVIVDTALLETNRRITIEIPKKFAKYILYKGYIGVDGISLTVGEVENHCFTLHLIPETLKRTTIGQKKQGDEVNIEIDPQTQAIVDTVTQLHQTSGNN